MNALTKPQPVAPSKYITVPLSAIADSPTNPRKSFDKAYIIRLANSIQRQGLLHAPIVVPARVAGVIVPNRYVMVTGHCRKRAFEELKREEIEVKLVDAGEVEQVEKQLIENDEREDLTAMERAEGYQLLHKKHGLSVDAIAERRGKTKAVIYASLKLCELIDAGKKLLREGQKDFHGEHQNWNPSCAELVARLPISLQPEVLERAKGGEYSTSLLSFRALKELIRDEYMLDLKDAPFDPKDAQLVPTAGACTNCVKRTGAQSDMFGGEKIGADVCTDRPCHQKKVAAHRAAVVKETKETGKVVLSAAESKAALSGNYSSDYVKLTDKHYEPGVKTPKTWGEELKATKLEPVIAVDSTGRTVKVVKKEDLREALAEAGNKKAAASNDLTVHRHSTPSKPVSEEDRKRAQAEEELHKKVIATATERFVAFIEKNGPTHAALRMVAKSMLSGWEGSAVFERRGLKQGSYDETGKHFEKHFGKAKANELFGLIVERVVDSARDGYGDEAEYSKELAEACELAGVNLAKLEEELAPPAKTTAQLKALVAKGAKSDDVGDRIWAAAQLKLKPKARDQKQLPRLVALYDRHGASLTGKLHPELIPVAKQLEILKLKADLKPEAKAKKPAKKKAGKK